MGKQVRFLYRAATVMNVCSKSDHQTIIDNVAYFLGTREWRFFDHLLSGFYYKEAYVNSEF